MNIELNPTPKQIRAITKLCVIRGIKEELESKIMTRREARNLIFELRSKK